MFRKIITILIIGMVFKFVVSFGIPVFAGDPLPGLDITIEQIPGGEVSAKIYDSSLSAKSVEQVKMEIGDALLRYGIGGEDINKVTNALEGSGVYGAELRSFLIAIGIGDTDVIAVFAKLDELGIGFIKSDDQEKAISTVDTEDILIEGEEDLLKMGDIADADLPPSDVSTADAEETSTLEAGFIKPDDTDKTISTSGTEDILIEGDEDLLLKMGEIADETPIQEEEQTIVGGFKSVAGMDSETAIQPATEEGGQEEKAISPPDTEDATQEVEGIELAIERVERAEVSPPDTEDTSLSAVVNAGFELVEDTSRSAVVNSGFELVENTTQKIDSFFDVYTELEVFIEVIADEANITKTEAGRVIDALMAVSPAFIIDEDGLQEEKEAKLIAVVIISALKSELIAKRALDAFVNATAKSLADGETVALVGSGSFSISKRKARTGRAKYQNMALKRSVFQNAAMAAIQNIRSAVPEERENLIDELRTSRGTWQTEILSMSLEIRKDAKTFRENFQEKFKQMEVTGYCVKCKEKKALIIDAHHRGILTVYRFSSAIARLDDIFKRIESRVARKQWLTSNFAIRISIEETKNKQLEYKATLEILTATYEKFLEGENLQEIAEEAKQIAQLLKAEIQTFHDKLRKIVAEIKNSIAINEEGLS